MAARVLRRLLSREGIASVLLVAVASMVCIGLGMWQWHRFEVKSERADVIAANYAAAPVALQDVLPDAGSSLAPEQLWTPVELHGSYCTEPGCTLYVRNRSYGQLVGFWQLVPFETDEGEIVLVVRGWVDTTEAGSTPAIEPPLPEGPATVIARMRPAESPLAGRSNPPGQVQTITPSQIAPLLPLDGTELLQNAYGIMATEDPAVTPLPRAPEAPDRSLGSHLAYTVQWGLFALFFPVALVVRTRRSLLDEDEYGGEPAEQGADEPAGAAAPARTSARGSRAVLPAQSAEARAQARRRSRDEEEEDALVDQSAR
ncbi:SURF1 family protein [Brachybacterium sp. JHP9]|uniref:SURF1-like protein n=1 Tax=Brachybacterium equifaecis TaxID=2910770 RepID=A0ABT0R2Z5_9MICO|nr:SURF1 family protein [Brachybacterium equifaecis]MCL6424130.1 SURF1 family protein [Brachybacterium equifaecis]